jgi:hypothetical protein
LGLCETQDNTARIHQCHEVDSLMLLCLEHCTVNFDLVVRVLGYRSRGPGASPGTTRKQKVVGLEQGPLSLMSTTEELLDRKVAAHV